MTNHPLGLGNRLKKQDLFEDPTLALQVYIRDPQPEFPRHSHGFDELVIILKGTAMHVIDEQEFPVKAGDVFVIAQNHEHQYQDMHGLALANILFDPDALGIAHWDIRTLPGFHALFSLEPTFRMQHNFKSRLQLSEQKLNQIKKNFKPQLYNLSEDPNEKINLYGSNPKMVGKLKKKLDYLRMNPSR